MPIFLLGDVRANAFAFLFSFLLRIRSGSTGGSDFEFDTIYGLSFPHAEQKEEVVMVVVQQSELDVIVEIHLHRLGLSGSLVVIPIM